MITGSLLRGKWVPIKLYLATNGFQKTDANRICRTGRQHLVFCPIFSGLGDYMRPSCQQIDPNQMTCGHQGLEKTDVITRCPIKRQKCIAYHILINLHDSMAPVRWKIGPNRMRSGQQGLVKFDTDTIC